MVLLQPLLPKLKHNYIEFKKTGIIIALDLQELGNLNEFKIFKARLIIIKFKKAMY